MFRTPFRSDYNEHIRYFKFEFYLFTIRSEFGTWKIRIYQLFFILKYG